MLQSSSFLAHESQLEPGLEFDGAYVTVESPLGPGLDLNEVHVTVSSVNNAPIIIIFSMNLH